MSVLAIKIPPRERVAARGAADKASAWRLPTEWQQVFSADGKQSGPMSSLPLAQLPKADEVVVVLSEQDVSWHLVKLPKANPARMRAALVGVMEEALLDDDEALHLALGEGAAPGAQAWVAVTHKPYLAAALAALESKGQSVNRVVAALPQPGTQLRGHFGHFNAEGNNASDGVAQQRGDLPPTLALVRDEGAWCVPVAAAAPNSLAALLRQLPPGPEERHVRWTSTPAAALAAERFLGRAVRLQTEAEHLLECAVSGVNLRQFDLSARHRGTRALTEWGKRLRAPEWRWARYGGLALLAFGLVGLNTRAWQQQQAIQSKRSALHDVLRTAHPSVRTVLDAPVQMAGETERLRVAAGQPGGVDLEVMLAAAANAWPDGKPPVSTLRYEPGRLTFTAPGWRDDEVKALRDRLRVAGWALEFTERRLAMVRLAAPTPTTPDPAKP
jgi:general secretion pathway protein L